MKAHIVGGGFGGLAAAVLLIRNAEVSGPDITIYEADEKLDGGFFLGGSTESGYNLPGSVFDQEYRCAFELLKWIPSARDPSKSVTEDFFDFNTGEPYYDKMHIFDRDGHIVHGPRFGLSLGDGLCLTRFMLTPEAMMRSGSASTSSFPSVFSRPSSGSSGRRSWARCLSTARSSFNAT